MRAHTRTHDARNAVRTPNTGSCELLGGGRWACAEPLCAVACGAAACGGGGWVGQSWFCHGLATAMVARRRSGRSSPPASPSPRVGRPAVVSQTTAGAGCTRGGSGVPWHGGTPSSPACTGPAPMSAPRRKTRKIRPAAWHGRRVRTVRRRTQRRAAAWLGTRGRPRTARPQPTRRRRRGGGCPTAWRRGHCRFAWHLHTRVRTRAPAWGVGVGLTPVEQTGAAVDTAGNHLDVTAPPFLGTGAARRNTSGQWR